MAQDSWPSPNHSSRNVTDAEYERIAARFSDDGVDGSPADTAVVSAGVGLQVVVRSGVYASVRGHAWYSGAVDDTLAIASNSSGSTRVDRVVLQLDRATWDVRAVVVQGTPGSGAPALTQDTGSSGEYEIPLAQVTVPDAAASVTVSRGEQYVGGRSRPCTSSTRPPNPRRGDQIYETDTGRWYGWTGASWVLTYEDTGEVALGAGYSSWQDQGSAVGRRIGNTVTLRISKIRKLAYLRRDDAASLLAQVPATLRPIARNHYYACQFSNGASGRVEVLTDGGMWVNCLSADVSPDITLSLTMTYLRY
ncbi:hypothetical protein [Streptomyces sp. CC228A]|uniref:hypothetical protein n=1 Tax=Streptomyces sp. CC228A TaxID=2898186 RepID=UPI001F326ECA|nr:hypothetical protein [Streptomyces sp. CC228A]